MIFEQECPDCLTRGMIWCEDAWACLNCGAEFTPNPETAVEENYE